ncbi:MAG: sensor histidine kinase [Salinibacter sp.]
MAESSAPLSPRVLAALDVALFERTASGRFTRLTPAPAWLEALWPEAAEQESGLAPAERFLFLESFLPEARSLWDGAAEPPSEGSFGGAALRSDPWTETTEAGEEWFLEAAALRTDDRSLLLLRPAAIDVAEYRAVLQEGRSLNLAYQDTQRALHQREIVIECLLHDLSGPLANLQDALSLLGDQAGSAPGDASDDLLHLAREQVHELSDAVQNALSEVDAAFRAEDDAPADLSRLLRAVGATLQSRAEAAKTPLTLADVPEEPLRVVAAPGRLKRVLRSLLERALRRTPEGTSIRVGVHVEERSATVTITDGGVPPPEHAVPHLFERFGPDAPSEHSDLSLYFARVAAESWGGTAGYQEREEGPTVWLRLPTADAA